MIRYPREFYSITGYRVPITTRSILGFLESRSTNFSTGSEETMYESNLEKCNSKNSKLKHRTHLDVILCRDNPLEQSDMFRTEFRLNRF